MIPFVEGFDYYPTATGVTGVAGRWTLKTSGFSLITGRFGDGQALFSSSGTSRNLTRDVSSTNTIACGVAIRISGASEVNANRRLIEFRNASGPQCGVGINAGGEIIAYRNTAGTVLGTATGVTFSDAVWHYIEVEAFVHDSTGFINVYKDGTQILAMSGVDTRQQTADTITFLRLYGTDGISAFPRVFAWDDVYATDQGTRLGECRVVMLYPDGATADADWTPSGGGDNHEEVNEAQVDGRHHLCRLVYARGSRHLYAGRSRLHPGRGARGAADPVHPPRPARSASSSSPARPSRTAPRRAWRPPTSTSRTSTTKIRMPRARGPQPPSTPCRSASRR